MLATAPAGFQRLIGLHCCFPENRNLGFALFRKRVALVYRGPLPILKGNISCLGQGHQFETAQANIVAFAVDS